jgi:hypothetical protein
MCTPPRLTVSRGHLLGVAVLFALAPLAQAQASETITATAHVTSRSGVPASSAPVRLVVDRFSTDAERDEVMAALKQGGTESVRALLSARDQIGSLQVGKTNTPIKYAYARPTGDGRLITAITAAPIAFLGSGLPGAPPKAGFELGLVLLEVAASRPGTGELVPAAKVRIDDQGGIVTEDYSPEVVRLSKVVGQK